MQAIYSDDTHLYLMGTNNLFKLNFKTNELSSLVNMKEGDDFTSACRDDKGNFWIGSNFGLLFYNKQTGKTEKIHTNLFNSVSSLAYDKKGKVWIGAQNMFFAYIINEKRFVILDESDGVPSNELIFTPIPALRTPNLYMGGTMGLVRINTDIIFESNSSPILKLLEVKLNGKSTLKQVNNNCISIPWNHSSFNIKVIADEKNSFRKHLFRYVITGKDKMVIESYLQTHTQNGFSADADDHIKQSVYAAFADYSKSIRHWKLNMGIRYEHQQTDYYEKGIRIDAQSPTYNDIIPVLAASWSHNGKSFSLSYRLRKNNPDYSLLTNSIRYRSKYEYSQGNPLLKTQKTHRFSASTSWNWLYFSAYFSRILNMYTNIIMPYKEDTHPGVLLFATQTIPTTHNYGISLNASPKLGYWEPQLNVNMAFLDMNANKIGITERRNQPRFYISLDNNFNLPKGWFFNIEGYLSTASRQGFFVTRTEGQISARLSKSFLNETLNIALTANDILHTGYYHFNLYGINAYMENRIYRDFQRFGLQVSYKFNATKSKYKGTGAGQSEKNRL